jgi:hypothetical protein
MSTITVWVTLGITLLASTLSFIAHYYHFSALSDLVDDFQNHLNTSVPNTSVTSVPNTSIRTNSTVTTTPAVTPLNLS